MFLFSTIARLLTEAIDFSEPMPNDLPGGSIMKKFGISEMVHMP